MENKKTRQTGRLSLYPMKLEDALRAIAKVKPEAKKPAVKLSKQR